MEGEDHKRLSGGGRNYWSLRAAIWERIDCFNQVHYYEYLRSTVATLLTMLLIDAA